MKLLGKIIIKGEIKVVTGLHIGGSKTSLDIGGVDNNVIKTINNIPYIPGSSLKGKLRSMLAKESGSKAVSRKDLPANIKNDQRVQTDENFNHICEIFGYSGDKDEECTPTRLIVRDSFLNTDGFKSKFEKEFDESGYTEEKTENVIDRLTGKAKHPRNIERVYPEAEFGFNLIFDVYDDGKNIEYLEYLKKAMQLLEDDYIGGSGTRGYGQIEFLNTKYVYKKLENNVYKSTGTDQEFFNSTFSNLN